jgi:hypothetical protein
MASHWFVPKSNGYGAYPANRKGWFAVLVFAVALILLAIVVFGSNGLANFGLLVPAAVFVLSGLVCGGLFICIARLKTKGEW